MPWRRRVEARAVLFSMMILGALGTGLGGTDATVAPDPTSLELLPPLTTTSSTTTTTMPLEVTAPPAAPVVLPPVLSPAEVGKAIERAMAAVLPGWAPLPADVAVFQAQVGPGTDLAAMARAFVEHRYANLITHLQAPHGPPCRLVVGPEALSEPAHRYPVACP